MGACWITGTFNDYNWIDGIRHVQNEYTEEYGYQDGYSGGPNCVGFNYAGDKSTLSQKDFQTFLNDRKSKVSKRDGEVVSRSVKEYHIFKTSYEVEEKVPEYIRIAMRRSDIGYKNPGPNFLVKYDNNGIFMRCLGVGKVTDLKRLAHEKLREGHYRNDMYIVPKSKSGRMIVCSGDKKVMKNTKRTSNETTLVAPYTTFVWYGWAPE